jgi:hypothetical protein
LPSSGAAPIDTVAEDMAALGVRDFKPPDWMLEPDPEDAEEFGVLPENWQAVNAFLACGTQWRHDRNGVPLGLRYEGVDVVLRRRGVENIDDAFRRVQVMEAAAVNEFANIARRKT